MGFLPLPNLDSRRVETSFKVRGKTLRVANAMVRRCVYRA